MNVEETIKRYKFVEDHRGKPKYYIDGKEVNKNEFRKQVSEAIARTSPFYKMWGELEEINAELLNIDKTITKYSCQKT